MRSLGYILVTVALVQLSGLDLVVAQLGAWGEMIHDRKGSGIVEAVTSTISGAAPCEKCLSIAKEKQKRNQDPRPVRESLDKLKLPLPKREQLAQANEQPYKQPDFIFLSHLWRDICLDLESPPPQLVG